jgi:hypothetical protein
MLAFRFSLLGYFLAVAPLIAVVGCENPFGGEPELEIVSAEFDLSEQSGPAFGDPVTTILSCMIVEVKNNGGKEAENIGLRVSIKDSNGRTKTTQSLVGSPWTDCGYDCISEGTSVFENICFFEPLSRGSYTAEVRVTWKGGSTEKSFPFSDRF